MQTDAHALAELTHTRIHQLLQEAAAERLAAQLPHLPSRSPVTAARQSLAAGLRLLAARVDDCVACIDATRPSRPARPTRPARPGATLIGGW